MKDINLQLRKAYVNKLTGIVVNLIPIKTFYLQAPDSDLNNNYIVIEQISNSDDSTMNSEDLSVNVTVRIVTQEIKANNGRDADFIAGEVLKRIIPSPQSKSNLDAFGITNLHARLSNDQVMNYCEQGGTSFVDRIIVFNHQIFIHQP